MLFEFENGQRLTSFDVLVSSVETNCMINPDGDLLLGVTAMQQLKFGVNNSGGAAWANGIAGLECVYKESGEATATNKFSEYRATGCDLVLWLDDLEKDSSVWVGTKGSAIYMQDGWVEEQPAIDVEALVAVNNYVYACHEIQPYVTTYKVDLVAKALEKQPQIPLTAHDIYHITQWLCREKVALNRQKSGIDGIESTADVVKMYKSGSKSYTELAYELLQCGIFLAQKPEVVEGYKLNVTAYDRMYKFDAIVDEWEKGVKYPVTLAEFLQSLCDYLGVELAPLRAGGELVNADMVLEKFAILQNVSGRELLSYICQAGVKFARLDEFGRLVLDWYHDTDIAVDATNSAKITVADYEVAKIDKLQIRVTDLDIGVIVGSGTNSYIIQDNPILYADSETKLLPVAQNIYNAICDFCYTPFSANINFAATIGSMLNFTTKTGKTFVAPVMQKYKKGHGFLQIKATGNRLREVQSDKVNRQLQRLRGKMSELTNTVDEFSVTLSEVSDETKGNTTQLQVMTGQINLKVDAKGIISAINMSPESIKINAGKVEITGFVTFSDLETTGSTIINGDNIKAGTIDASKVVVENLNADKITGGTIQSSAFTTTSNLSGVTLNAGSLKFFDPRPQNAYFSEIGFRNDWNETMWKVSNSILSIGVPASGYNPAIKIVINGLTPDTYLPSLTGTGDVVKIDSSGKLYRGNAGGGGGGYTGSLWLTGVYQNYRLDVENGLIVAKWD